MAKIFFVRGPLRRQEYVLKADGFTMGRAPGNDVVLPDDSVSRRHARFAWAGDGWVVADMGSLNGIRVNGEAVREKRLLDRDVVVVGRSDIAFLERDDSEFSFEDRTADLRKALRTRYTVVEQLGSGAQADVYRAERADGRACAIKVLTKAADAGTSDVRRFQREARALMQLRHPHIVEILEVDEADGFNFMALEFLGAGSLEDHLVKVGRIGWRLGLSILADLARALVHAHARSIFHRDIKPANILFRGGAAGTAETGDAVLSDFGIAQILETTKLTRTGMVFGTPYFMSPGRLSGEPATEYSDLYALGATLYVAMTGQYPFPGNDVDDIIRSMKLGEALPAALLEPHIPRPVSVLLGRLLRRSNPDRIESAGELLREIDVLPRDLSDGPAPEDRVGGTLQALRHTATTDVGLSYLMRDLDANAAEVVVKFVAPLAASARDFPARLQRLAEATGCRTVPRGNLTLLLAPALPGRTLGDLVTEGRPRGGLPVPLALAITHAVVERLAASKLAHGDLDPSAVQLLPDARLQLLEPGYATLLDATAYAASRRTGAKLPYTAPELLTGAGATVAGDVYAAGALAFWLLSGQVPIDPGPQVERIERIITGRIRWDALKQLGVPAPVVDLVRAMMATSPAKRPAADEAGATMAALPVRAVTTSQLAEFVASPRPLVQKLLGGPA